MKKIDSRKKKKGWAAGCCRGKEKFGIGGIWEILRNFLFTFIFNI